MPLPSIDLCHLDVRAIDHSSRVRTLPLSVNFRTFLVGACVSLKVLFKKSQDVAADAQVRGKPLELNRPHEHIIELSSSSNFCSVRSGVL